MWLILFKWCAQALYGLTSGLEKATAELGCKLASIPCRRSLLVFMLPHSSLYVRKVDFIECLSSAWSMPILSDTTSWHEIHPSNNTMQPFSQVPNYTSTFLSKYGASLGIKAPMRSHVTTSYKIIKCTETDIENLPGSISHCKSNFLTKLTPSNPCLKTPCTVNQQIQQRHYIYHKSLAPHVILSENGYWHPKKLHSQQT